MLEWDEKDDQVIVRRAGRYSSSDVHEAIFAPGGRKPKRPVDVKEGIRKYIRKRHARR